MPEVEHWSSDTQDTINNIEVKRDAILRTEKMYQQQDQMEYDQSGSEKGYLQNILTYLEKITGDMVSLNIASEAQPLAEIKRRSHARRSGPARGHGRRESQSGRDVTPSDASEHIKGQSLDAPDEYSSGESMNSISGDGLGDGTGEGDGNNAKDDELTLQSSAIVECDRQEIMVESSEREKGFGMNGSDETDGSNKTDGNNDTDGGNETDGNNKTASNDGRGGDPEQE